ncbi:MAG: alpha-E domain-containing protein [Roseiflexaceae bacterium]|nr:alpha-E domain-containing protein [Roseiflexaceae bacterium]
MLSRVADSLYWMSRYVERAEHTARLIDVNLVLMLDQSPEFALQRWERLTDSLLLEPPEADHDITQFAHQLTFDRDHHGSIMACLTGARDNARQVREQLSSELWEQVNRMYLAITHARSQQLWQQESHALLRQVIDGLHLFHGIAESTMSQGEGWQWLQLGRFLERTSATCLLLETYFSAYLRSQEQEESVREYLDWVGLLKSCTAFEAYCQVYTADLQPARVAEFLLLSADFPRSVRFSGMAVQRSLQKIAQSTRVRKNTTVSRLAGRLATSLDYAAIKEIMAEGMLEYLRDIREQCGHVHNAIQRTYIAPPLESLLEL